jgi:hypothetical protein
MTGTLRRIVQGWGRPVRRDPSRVASQARCSRRGCDRGCSHAAITFTTCDSAAIVRTSKGARPTGRRATGAKGKRKARGQVRGKRTKTHGIFPQLASVWGRTAAPIHSISKRKTM